jgi:membrane-associated protease RseP (regulator of RpoE activity)
VVIPVESVEGILLVPATLFGANGRDTSGVLVLDTGSGSLALDRALAGALGIADAQASGASVELLPRPLARVEIGTLQMDQVAPVLAIDGGVVRRAIDRPVLGLLGERLLERGIIVVDDAGGRLAFLPSRDEERPPLDPVVASRAALGAALSPRARAVRFRLAGDGKMLVRVAISAPRGFRGTDSLTLIVDTGATKCVLFEDGVRAVLPRIEAWPSLRGLSAPTLFGAAPARVVRLASLALGERGEREAQLDVDAIVMGGRLATTLQAVVGEPVHGLLGYSFLRHYRLAMDFPRRLLWLDPSSPGHGARPFEYSQPGIQVERADRAALVTGVVKGSPAARAGLAVGDTLVRVDGLAADSANVIELARALEGRPGTRVRLQLRRGSRDWICTLVRRQLL